MLIFGQSSEAHQRETIVSGHKTWSPRHRQASGLLKPFVFQYKRSCEKEFSFSYSAILEEDRSLDSASKAKTRTSYQCDKIQRQAFRDKHNGHPWVDTTKAITG